MSKSKDAKGSLETDFHMETPIIEKSPIYQIDLKRSFENGFTEPKEAESHFQLISYNEDADESLVLCRPITGRQHQLRIHLLRLGHSIPGDFIYDLEATYYPKKIKFIKDHPNFQDSNIPANEMELLFNEFRKEFEDVINDVEGVEIKVCEECGQEEFYEPPLEQMKIYLHSFRYRIVENDETPDLCFQTNPPKWISSFK